MSNPKTQKDQLLSRSVRILGHQLGAIIQAKEGKKAFEKVESLRVASKNAAKAFHEFQRGEISDENFQENLSSFEEVKQAIDAMEHEELVSIATAFTHFFHLVNTAEQALLSIRPSTSPSLASMRPSVPNLRISPVFTAHPTEARKKSVRRLLDLMIGECKLLFPLLEQSETSQSPDIESLQISDIIAVLWNADLLESDKPSPLIEIEHALPYFETALQSAAKINLEQDNHTSQKLPPLISFGSWIGGDRDGNPFVSGKTTLTALAKQHDLIIQLYSEKLFSLKENLIQSEEKLTLSERFQRRVTESMAMLPESDLSEVRKLNPLPFAQFAEILRLRLALGTVTEGGISPSSLPLHEYMSDLTLLREEAIATKCFEALHIEGGINELIALTEMCGYHMASVDIREHSENHSATIHDVLTFQEGTEYQSLPNQDRVELLATLLKRPGVPFFLNDEYDSFHDTTRRTIDTWQSIVRAQKRYGENAVPNYIISMTEHESDIFEVLLLAKQFTLTDVGHKNTFSKLNIIPLFETIDDLKRAPEILDRLFAHPIYQEQLRLRENRQEIMLGYSDSCKDGGFLRSNLSLYEAQERIVDTAQKHGIEVSFFHGRGGATGRGGGGPISRAILGQPPGSITGTMRITQQGEVIHDTYSSSESADHYLRELATATIENARQGNKIKVQEHWRDTISELAEIAEETYRQFIYSSEDYYTFFDESSPLNLFELLNIGSRPSKRKKERTITQFRAIPKVFAENQNRSIIQSWYGTGSAFLQCREKNSALVETLREMYAEWDFFHAIISNLSQTFMKVNPFLFEIYAANVQDEGIRERYKSLLLQEYAAAREFLLAVTAEEEIMGGERELRKAIALRETYLIPLHCIQARTLCELQDYSLEERSNFQDSTVSAFRISTVGIVNGLKNTG